MFMPIITSIRNFLHLDKVTLSYDQEFTDSVGLWINEKNQLMKEPEFQGCFGPRHYSFHHHHSFPPDLHQDQAHPAQDFHFLHF